MIAVNDGKVVKLGASERLGRYVVLQDVYGNTYTYANLGSVAKTYPTPKKRTSKKDSDTGAKRRGIEHEGTADAKAAKTAKTASEPAKPAETGAPVAKVRLFAHPERKNAKAAGGDAQLTGEDTEELASAGAPLGLNPKDFVAKRLVKGVRVLGGTTLGRIGKTSEADGPAPAVRDPPGRPRRPAHRPEADPRRLEAARVDRGLPRQGQERALRRRRRGPQDRPDHADEQGDAGAAACSPTTGSRSTAAAAPTSARARSTAACSRRSPTSPPPA